jgi:fucose 4-O-acetylase-like acetyltransferase
MIPVINQHTTFWFGPAVLQGTMQYVHFHTRTFCFVSGLTAQGLPNDKSIKSIVFRLIAPTMLWTLVGFAYFDRDTLKNRTVQAQITYLFQGLLMAPGISWYMYALVCWRIMGWGLMSFKPIARAVVSVLILIMSGYIIDSPGFLRNAGIYLPIFVAGQLFPLKEVMARLPVLTPSMFIAGMSILLLTARWEYSQTGLSFLAEIPFYSWGSIEGPPDGYCDFGAFSTFWLRGLFRNALELSKGLVIILLCCPRQENMLSRMGQYSIYTYLLHPWCQDLVNEGIKFYDWRPHPNAASSSMFQWACVFGAIAYAFTMNVFLTSKPVRTIFGPILEPTWLEGLFAAETKETKQPSALPSYGTCKA